MLAGTRLPAGMGYSTVLPDMDFETYSEAGFIWDETKKAYYAPKGATKKSIYAVGSVVYSEHPTAEILSLAYDMKDNLGPRIWLPNMPPPQELFDHIAQGGLIEAWSSFFEFIIWDRVCVARLGWPPLPFWQLRDAAAKSRAFAYPGALGKAAAASRANVQKMTEGQRLINKFSCPRKPTKNDPRRRILMSEDLTDAQLMIDYNVGDIKSEAAVSQLCPDLTRDELEFELCTQAMNVRGVALDMETVNAGVKILDAALVKYNAELEPLTGGAVTKASQGARTIDWLATRGVSTPNLDAEAVTKLLDNPLLPPDCRRALEIRQLVGSAGVKKLYAMQRMASREGRAHDLFIFNGARTGRDAGRDLQPQNLVKAGPKLKWCKMCKKPFGASLNGCVHCGFIAVENSVESWSHEAVDHAVQVIRTGCLEEVERVFGDALLTLSGCIRGMFVSGPGKDFICSDYSSIEAVVTAVMAGEAWRIEAFRNKEDIYLHSAARITGRTYEFYKQYHAEHGHKHEDRQKIGKPAELGLGFGGWVNAWYQFDKSGTFSEQEIKNNILAWRDASPGIPELWGGQVRGKPWNPTSKEMYGLEGAAINAVLNPGTPFSTHGITYEVRNDKLFCKLPSGRYLTYHTPRLYPSEKWPGQLSLSFWGYNTNPKKGPIGWVEMYTYGGSLCENIVQAIANDIMRFAVPALERAGYPIVLRVHDEIVAEVPEGFGNIEELEKIMGTMPAWASDWPIRAAGGWRAKRYRKD